MRFIRLFVINCLTKHLLKAVTQEEVLLVAGKEWLINKRKLSPEEIISLKEEAISLRESLLWKLLVKELRYGATLQRYDHAKTVDDMMFGKAQAYCISQIELFIERIAKL